MSALGLLGDRRWLEGAGQPPRAVSHVLSRQGECRSPATSCVGARQEGGREGGQVKQAFLHISALQSPKQLNF